MNYQLIDRLEAQKGKNNTVLLKEATTVPIQRQLTYSTYHLAQISTSPFQGGKRHRQACLLKFPFLKITIMVHKIT